MEAFYAVLPVFLLIAVGAAVHMTDVLPENTGAAMGLYVLKLALPVLMVIRTCVRVFVQREAA